MVGTRRRQHEACPKILNYLNDKDANFHSTNKLWIKIKALPQDTSCSM